MMLAAPLTQVVLRVADPALPLLGCLHMRPTQQPGALHHAPAGLANTFRNAKFLWSTFVAGLVVITDDLNKNS